MEHLVDTVRHNFTPDKRQQPCIQSFKSRLSVARLLWPRSCLHEQRSVFIGHAAGPKMFCFSDEKRSLTEAPRGSGRASQGGPTRKVKFVSWRCSNGLEAEDRVAKVPQAIGQAKTDGRAKFAAFSCSEPAEPENVWTMYFLHEP